MGIIDIKVNARFVRRKGSDGKFVYADRNSRGSISKEKWTTRRNKYYRELLSQQKAHRTLKRNASRHRAAQRGGYELGNYKDVDGTVFSKILTTLRSDIDKSVNLGLLAAQVDIMAHAEKAKKYTNLKGDTYVSTMSAVYHGTRKPVLMQLPGAIGKQSTGRYMLQKNRGNRSGSHKVKLFDTGEYIYYPDSRVTAINPPKKGYDVAVEKLMGYYKGGKQGLGRDNRANVISGIILTTGTEHTSYLESKRGLNVLSATKNVAFGIVKKHIEKYFKYIKRK